MNSIVIKWHHCHDIIFTSILLLLAYSAYDLKCFSYFKVLRSWTAIDRLGHLFRLDKYMLLLNYYDYSLFITIHSWYIYLFILKLAEQISCSPLLYHEQHYRDVRDYRDAWTNHIQEEPDTLVRSKFSLINPFWG